MFNNWWLIIRAIAHHFYSRDPARRSGIIACSNGRSSPWLPASLNRNSDKTVAAKISRAMSFVFFGYSVRFVTTRGPTRGRAGFNLGDRVVDARAAFCLWFSPYLVSWPACMTRGVAFSLFLFPSFKCPDADSRHHSLHQQLTNDLVARSVRPNWVYCSVDPFTLTRYEVENVGIRVTFVNRC